MLKRVSRVFSSDEDDDDDLENSRKRANTNSNTNSTSVPNPKRPASSDSQLKTSVFEKTLKESGLNLDTSGDPVRSHILICDQAVFQKKLSANLKKFLNPDNVETFCNESIELLESSDEALTKALNPTKTSPSCQSARSTVQDSLVRLLLGIDQVHVKLSTWLLEKLALVSLENEDHDDHPFGKDLKSNLPQLILSQLRWLDRGVSRESLVSKILEILEASSVSAQHEIIACLPEIVDDKFHTRIAMALRDKLSNDGYQHRLTNAILDTMSNLSLRPDETSEIRRSILKNMSVVSIDDLPVIVRFILSTIQEGEELEVISALREELELSPAPAAAMTQLSQQRKTLMRLRRPSRTDPRDIDVIVLDIVRIAMTGNQKIGDAWFRSIDSSREHKPLDILVLLQLQALPNRRRQVESLFKNKVRNGSIAGDLIDKTFKKHSTPLQQSYESLVGIAEALMQSGEPALSLMSNRLLCAMFHHLGRYFQQEIICDLVTKIGSGGSSTLRATALSILETLAVKYTEALCNYALFTASVLDHTDTMNLEEVRKVMDILSKIAFASHTTTGGLKDDLHIIVRKQISSGKLFLKRMGVVGAVAIVRNMSPKNQLSNESTSSSGRSNSSNRLAEKMLDMAKEATISVGDVAGLLMDELATLVLMNVLNPELVEWISKTMTDSFVEEYVVDLDSKKSVLDKEFIPLATQYQLKYDDDYPIVVNLGPLVCRNMRGGLQKCSRESTAAVRLIPHFRLLAACENAKEDGNLTSVDALLGCPVWMPQADTYEKFDSLSSSEKNVTCASVFYCINWFRELINCFTRSKEPDDRKRVLVRIKNILKLEQILMKILPKNINFVPPTVLPLVEVSTWHPPTLQTTKSGSTGKSAKGKGKGKKRKIEESTLHTQTTQFQTETIDPIELELSTSGFTNLDHYRPFFREMDIEVHKLYSIDKVTLGPIAESDDDDVDDPTLRPPELLFLLNDLFSKVSRVLVESKTKKGFPGKVNELKNAGFSSLDRFDPAHVANLTVLNLDYLLTHLEEIAEYFKRTIDLNDGLIDGPVIFNDQTPVLVACYEKLILIIRSLFSWNGFQARDQRILLKKGLNTVACRSNPSLKETANLIEQVKGAFDHFSRLSKSIINLGCADGLLKLLEAVRTCYGDIDGDNEDVQASMCSTAKSFLKTEWRNPLDGSVEKGAKFNTHIESLLNIYLNNSDQFLEAMGDYSKDLEEILDKKGSKDVKASETPTFTKLNLPMHYRVFFLHLNSYTRGLTFGVNKDHTDLFERWEASTPIFNILVTVPKKMSIRVVLGTLLKNSRVYLDAFIKHCMPVIDVLFGKNRESCIRLLKSMQQSTRYLQHVCQHSKTNKDVSLSNHVPALKKSLETFVFRVKVTLAVNNAVSSFWMGNLKNRNLEGKEIQTQAVQDESETETEDTGHDDDEGSDHEAESDVELDGDGGASPTHPADDNEADISIAI